MEAAAHYDLIVVGAGPAGNACAITAARAGASVLLLEKDLFPRHKVCGEFVSSEALRLLGSLLGHTQFSSHLEINSARMFLETRPERAAQFLHLPVSPPALSIPRFDLDTELLSAARSSGVRVEETMPALKVRRNGVFNVSTANQTFTAKAVVNASGRWSKLSRHEIAPRERWIGMKAHFSEASAPNSVDLYFFPGGYCGVTPLGKDSVNACAMVRAEAAHSLPQVFAQHPELWRRSRNWELLVPEITTSPLFFRQPETESDGILQAGDAAGFIDPFAGDGISLALHSGALAGECLAPFQQGRCSLPQAYAEFRSRYHARFRPVFRNAARIRLALRAPSWLRSVGMRIAATRTVASILVRSTRVAGCATD